MTNDEIPLSECAPVLARARTFVSDPKVGKPHPHRGLGKYRGLAVGIIKNANKYGHLTPRQLSALERATIFYERVVEQNNSYSPALSSEFLDVIDQTQSTLKFLQPVAPRLKTFIGKVRHDSEHIRSGFYFWAEHLSPTLTSLEAAREFGADIQDLETKAQTLYEQTKVAYPNDPQGESQ